MSDLIDEYKKSGLISDPTRNFRRCDGCEDLFHPDDLNTVDIEECDGRHNTLEICDDCLLTSLEAEHK